MSGREKMAMNGDLLDKGCPLDDSVLMDACISNEHREVFRAVPQMVDRIGYRRARVRVALNAGRVHLLTIIPEREACSRISLFLYIDPTPTAGTVGLLAGSNAYVNIPEDVYPPLPYALPTIVSGAAKAIMEGRLEETIYEAGSVVYRWAFRLPTDLGLISVERFRFSRLLTRLFRRKNKRTIVYPPYGDVDSLSTERG